MNVEVGAYRIIQEALTNALRHAGSANALVELDYQPDQLALDISNGGGAPAADAPADSSGYGVLGMVQRTAVLGGLISVGPVPGRGFQVSARLPVYEV
jgi:signal transduction histidine kinase